MRICVVGSLFFRLAYMLVLLGPAVGFAQTPLGSAFSYQGRLVNVGVPGNGNFDFEFRLRPLT